MHSNLFLRRSISSCLLTLLLIILLTSSFSTWAIDITKARIIISIQDEFKHSGQIFQFSEKIVSNALTRSGFKILNEKQLTKNKVKDEHLYHLDNDDETVAIIAFQNDAEYMIRGRSVITSGKSIMGTKMKPRHANIEIELYLTDTGQIIYSDQFSNSTPHIDEVTGGKIALKASAEQSIRGVLRILRRKERLIKIKQYELFISDINTYRDFSTLQNNLKKLDLKIKVVSFNRGVGQLDISGEISIDQLADLLTNMVFDGKSLEIVDLSNNRVQTKVIEGTQASSQEPSSVRNPQPTIKSESWESF